MLLYNYRYIILAAFFILQLGIFWPGISNPDSQSQYQQAMAGIYSDHHPAMMAFVWHWFNKIYPGFWSMYLLQLSFLYMSLLFIMKTAEEFIDFKKQPWSLCLIFFIPLWPQILLWIIQIQKDNHFAFSYLMVAGILAYYTVTKKTISFVPTLLLILALIYGTAVKYQAQFLLPIFGIWLGILLTRNKPIWAKITSSFLTIITIYVSIFSINTALVPEAQKTNS